MLEEWIIGLGVVLAYVAYFTIIFAESGLLIGFFLPGDSFLFTMGILASRDFFRYPVLLGLGMFAAIAGDSVGYFFGRKYGRQFFSSDRKRRFFNQDHLEKAEAFYARHGVKTIILARFTPVVRTFAPILAGVGEMEYKLFVTYNILGGIFWVFSLVSAGYFLGQSVPNIDQYILPIIAVIIVLSVSPAVMMKIKQLIKRRAD